MQAQLPLPQPAGPGLYLPARLPSTPLRRRSRVLAVAALPVLLIVNACCASLTETPMRFVCAYTHPCGAARL